MLGDLWHDFSRLFDSPPAGYQREGLFDRGSPHPHPAAGATGAASSVIIKDGLTEGTVVRRQR